MNAKTKIPTKVFELQAQPQEEVPFIAHAEAKPMGSYLTMNLDYGPFKKIKEELEVTIGKKLKDRGEAHITIVSPLEYDRQLKKLIRIEAIQSIALLDHVQKSDLKFLCIGHGQILKQGRKLDTYFVVVESKHLKQLRHKVLADFVKNGGNKNNFDADLFFPHVTLGFTERDLHLEDGVKKDKKSCLYKIKLNDKK